MVVNLRRNQSDYFLNIYMDYQNSYNILRMIWYKYKVTLFHLFSFGITILLCCHFVFIYLNLPLPSVLINPLLSFI